MTQIIKTAGKIKFFALEIESDRKRKAYTLTATNIVSELGGLEGLEDSLGHFWNSSPDASRADRAISVLESYNTRRLGMGSKQNWPLLNDIITQIKKTGSITPSVVDLMQNAYRSIENVEGSAARRLKYVMARCSEHCTATVMEAVNINIEREQALRAELEARVPSRM